MSTVFEKLVANLSRWEVRGRGVLTFPEPVSPEPPFVPFPGHRLPAPLQADTGRRPTFFSRLADNMAGTLRPPATGALAVAIKEPEEPEPHWLGKEEPSLVELRLLLPQDMTVSPEAMSHFLSNVSLASHPLTLEFIGTAGQVSL